MPPFTFGQDRRLRRHAEFVRAQRTGRRVATPHFTLLVARQPDSKSEAALPRIGFVVSGKVGSAVKRNRVKRVCRECFRTWPNLLPPGVDLVVIARPGAPALSSGQVRAEWLAVQEVLRHRAAEALNLGSEVQGRTRAAPRAGGGTEGA